MSEVGDFSADISHLLCVLALGWQDEQNCLSTLFSDSTFSGTLSHHSINCGSGGGGVFRN